MKHEYINVLHKEALIESANQYRGIYGLNKSKGWLSNRKLVLKANRKELEIFTSKQVRSTKILIEILKPSQIPTS